MTNESMESIFEKNLMRHKSTVSEVEMESKQSSSGKCKIDLLDNEGEEDLEEHSVDLDEDEKIIK